ncbi:hypothetical protein BC835DRAFT_1521597 [Cytidiella melzeri]|nr:hypothetical protein BC835DRAFT_1521597 [Cytidiella melzeri]
MSASTTKAASSASQRLQVFVEIPYSSLSSRPAPSELSFHPRIGPTSDVKENTPLTPLRTTISRTAMTTNMSSGSKKRKSSEEDSTLTEDSTASKIKKAKLSSSAPQPAGKAATTDKVKQNESTRTKGTGAIDNSEFPNGYFYCHQCCRKRDTLVGVHCTWKRVTPGSKGQLERCKARYCSACLKNRYQEDMDAIMSRGNSALSAKQREQHVLSGGFHYQCPRCRDECNCRTCRKAKGLEPTGNFNLAARKAEKAAAAKAKDKSTNTQKAGKASQASGKTETFMSAKPRAKPKPKAKSMPKPVWTRVATDLTLDSAETRIHIREFAVRFASVLQLTNTQLEELDEISGDNLGEAMEWDNVETEDVEIISWVSDTCAKSIILGLMDVIADGADTRGHHADSKALRDATKNVKASGANLNRVWTALADLRESLGMQPSLVFANPLPPPASAVIRTTRRNKDSDMHISNSAQLVPVIVDLIEAVMSSPALRDALEAGAAEEKEYGKLAREAVAAENNRWKEIKESKAPKDSKKADAKGSREQHQQRIEDLEYAHRLASLRYISRFSPLGRDADGRVYYAMTPGMGESDASMNLLKGKDGRVKVGRKRGGFTEDDREEMERWSWFVAVWGRKPDGAEEARHHTLDEEEGEPADDSEEECWWGFWQPQEVQKIAEWLTVKFGLEDDADTRQVVNPNTTKAAGGMKAKAARGRASTGSSSLTSLSSSHVSSLTAISELSDEDPDARISFQRPLGHKRELQDLVNGLKDFADLLQWRIKRASAGTLQKSSAKVEAVPVNRFYG